MYDDGISVIIPVYNAEDFIKKCLKSITKQTFENLEIICVIDKKTEDNSEKICNLMKKDDKRIKVIKNSDGVGGAGNNRNVGLDAATKEYIGFVDADDYIEYDYYEKLYDACKMFNADIALADVVEMDVQKRKIHRKIKYNLQFEYILAKMFGLIQTGSVWDKLFKADLIKKNNIRFMEGVIYEDTPFILETFHRANKLVTAPGSSYFWQRNNESVTISSDYDLKRKDAFTVSKYIVNYLKTNNIPKYDANFVAFWLSTHLGVILLDKEKYKTPFLDLLKGFDIKIP